jgi:hypothetical protein
MVEGVSFGEPIFCQIFLDIMHVDAPMDYNVLDCDRDICEVFSDTFTKNLASRNSQKDCKRSREKEKRK